MCNGVVAVHFNRVNDKKAGGFYFETATLNFKCLYVLDYWLYNKHLNINTSKKYDLMLLCYKYQLLFEKTKNFKNQVSR